MIIQIDTGYACFGLVAQKGIIKSAPDIAKLSEGKSAKEVCEYYLRNKKAKIQIKKDSDEDWKWYGIKGLYCDAGVFETGISEKGFVYAVVLVDVHDEKVFGESYTVMPEDLGITTTQSDLAETYAMMMGFKMVFPYDAMTVYTDNYNAYKRATRTTSWNGVPEYVKNDMVEELKRLKVNNFIHLGGHPCKRALARGYRCGDGMPVSKWNVFCDTMCNLQKREYLKSKKT